MSQSDLDHGQEKLISQLIQTSGRGPSASPDARARIYKAVHAEWLRNVDRPAVEARRPLPFIDWLMPYMKPGLAIVGIAAVTVVASTFLFAPVEDQAIGVAAIERAIGNVSIVSEDGGRAAVNEGSDRAIEQGDTLVVAPGAAAAIVLPGGETLRLDANSALKFVASDRVELEQGRVYFDSGKTVFDDSAFSITTRYGDVRHVGTQYEALLGRFDLRVRVREGSVSIRDDSQELIGRAGEQIVLPESGQPVRSEISPFDPDWRWTENLAGVPEASEYDLTELLSWIARQTGRELRYETPAVEDEAAGLVLHSVGGLTPLETFDVIASTTALDYRMTEDSIVVY